MLLDRIGVKTALQYGLLALELSLGSGARSLQGPARAVWENVDPGVFKFRCRPKCTRSSHALRSPCERSGAITATVGQGSPLSVLLTMLVVVVAVVVLRS